MKWKRIIFPFTKATFSSYTTFSMMLVLVHTTSCVKRYKRHSAVSRQAKFYVLSFSDKIYRALNWLTGLRFGILSENLPI